MKPFNLEKFLAGEPAITRDGIKVIDWHYFKNKKFGCPFIYMVEGDGNLIFVDENGLYSHGSESEFDLFMEEKEVDLWINVYKMDSEFYLVGKYDTEGEALVWATVNHEKGKKFISTHKITIKE